MALKLISRLRFLLSLPGRRSRIERACRAHEEKGEGLRLLCLGDSLTDSSYPRHLEQSLRDFGLPVEVVALGFPGDNSRELLWTLRRFEPQKRLRPNWTLLLIGTNDSRRDLNHVPTPEFVENLNQLQTLLAPCILSTVPPVVPVRFHFSVASVRRVREEINPGIRRLARTQGLPCLDLEAAFDPAWLRAGNVHPGEGGYAGMANALGKGLAPLLRNILASQGSQQEQGAGHRGAGRGPADAAQLPRVRPEQPDGPG